MFQEIEDELDESQQTTSSTTMSSYQMFAEKEMEKLRDRILELERTSDTSNENKLKKAIRRSSEIERASLTLKVENAHMKSELESLREEVKRLRTSNVNLKDQNEGLLVQLDVMKKSFMQTAKEKMELKSKLSKLSPSPAKQNISNSTSSPSRSSPMTMRAKAFMGRFLSPKQ
jgi:chromosome segregation ATPase